jgi:hypothetical protein
MPTITNQKVDSMRKDGTAIKVGTDWFSSYQGRGLNGVEWGDMVTFEYQQKGQFNNIQGHVHIDDKKGASGVSADKGSTVALPVTSPQARNAGVEVGHAWNSAVQIALVAEHDPESILRLASDLAPRVYSICSAFRDMAASGELHMDSPYDFEMPAATDTTNPTPDLSSIAGEAL